MSGGTIGAVLGAGIGFLVGGPAGAKIGWMVGSLVGGYVDPQKIEGPRLKDATRQTSQDGIPIPFGYGSFPTTGNLIWTDRLVETKSTKRQGKGGPKVTEYTYTRSYAVGVCEGEIAGYLIVKRNGKIVYDTRTNAELTAAGYTSAQIAESRAAQTKWLETATLYYGGETQSPDPTMTAVKGAGNVPAYRGLAYIVANDEDLTQERGAVPQYDFVVSVCGERTEADDGTARILITGNGNTGSPTPFICAEAEEVPTFVGIPTATGADVNNTACSVNAAGVWIAVGEDELLYSTDITSAWTSIATAFPTETGRFGVYGPDGWLLQYRGVSHTGLLASAASTPTDVDAVSVDLAGTPRSSFSWINYTGGKYYGCIGFGGTDLLWSCATIGGVWASVTSETGSLTGAATEAIRFFYDIVEFEGALYAACYNASAFGGLGGGDVVRKSTDGGATLDELVIDGRDGTASPFQMCLGNGILIVVNRDVTKVWTSADGFTTAHSTGVSRSIADLPRNEKEGRFVAYASGRFFIMGDTGAVSTTDGITFGAVASYPATFTGPVSIAALGYDGTELPDSPGHYVDDDGVVNGPAGTTVDRCTPELGADIVTDLCARRDVTDIDVSELTDLVDGFKIATETDPATAIDSTRAAYFYDASEYDGVIHFPKRGGSPVFALTMDDLAARDGDPIEWERVQEAELLRKVTVAYIDPATTYTQTTQKWERRTGTVEAKGEGSVEIPVVGTKDFAAQVAEKRGKAAWAETDKCRFSLPYKWAKLTPADVGTLTDALGKVHRIRILSIEDDSGYRHVEAVREQTNTYVSTAAGSSGPTPTYPGSGLAGPTVSAIMNLPVLRDEDDKAGLYIAAAGMLPGWQGALIQLSRDGGASYENGPIIASNATIGELTATLPTATQYTLDSENTLSVSMTPYADSLDSITLDQLLNEGNPCAIVKADGTAEILQFQTATETSPGNYDLTGLVRGALDTTPATHAIGAKFVLLNDAIRFLPLAPTDLGRVLTIRTVSVGTPAASNASYTITTTSLESVREWQPYDIEIESDGASGYCISWVGRARLGSDAFPQHSQFFDGYSVRLTDGVVIHDIETDEQSVCVTAAEMTAIFGGGYGVPTVSVVAKSTSSQQAFNPAAPTGWVALSGTWTEDPAGVYNLIPDGSTQGRMYYDTPYAFTTGTFEASVEWTGPILAGFAGLTVDFMDADGLVFITENGSDVPLVVTAASLVPFGTVASARVYLRALSGSPISAPVTFSSLTVTVTP